MRFEVVLLHNKSNPFGILRDIEGLQAALQGEKCSFRCMDPLEPPIACDLAIHLEVPVYVWMPYATQNALFVNPEWFSEAWIPYLARFDKLLFKDTRSLEIFQKTVPDAAEKCSLLHWGARPPKSTPKVAPVSEFLWLLGGSVNKRAYTSTLVPAWKESYPPLHIYSTVPLDAEDISGCASNVKIHIQELKPEKCVELSRTYRGHICCSRSEGFGHSAAEAEWNGAFTILNRLPVYVESYEDQTGVAFLPSVLKAAPHVIDTAIASEIQEALDAAIQQFSETPGPYDKRPTLARERFDRFKTEIRALISSAAALQRPRTSPLPPVLEFDECPPITILTLMHNRRKFFDLACHNILMSDYPKEKIQWIIVEDSTDPAEDASDLIVPVQQQTTRFQIVYIPLAKKTPIGEKRNLGIQKATADIILLMDDDDHYPATSFRRRVAWLLKHPWKPTIAAATTIACYDLVKGISAVNTPPLQLPFGQRVSEATLTFYKSVWEERGFPSDVQVGEGEGFLTGRESSCLELPPQQCIVAFSHGKNVSSRRIPTGDDLKPGCFWGFPKEYLMFVHGLAGITVVEDKRK
jgi:hypothetical protein